MDPNLILPLISVIIPIYRYNTYCYDALQSILNQTFNNIEIILVCEYDIELIEELILRLNDKRIIIIKGANRGLSAALNLGISYAKGLYIARMDSDDIAYPERLEEQLHHLILTNGDICGSNIMVHGLPNKQIFFPVSCEEIRLFALWGSPFAHSTVMGKKNVFIDNRYDENIKASEDFDLWIRLIKGGYSLSNLPKILLQYRIINTNGPKNNFELETDVTISNNYLHYLESHDHTLQHLGFGRYKSYTLEEVQFIVKKIIQISTLRICTNQSFRRIIIGLILKINNNAFNSILYYIRTCIKLNYNINFLIIIYLVLNILFPNLNKLKIKNYIKKFYNP